jgi:hypothetical protein
LVLRVLLLLVCALSVVRRMVVGVGRRRRQSPPLGELDNDGERALAAGVALPLPPWSLNC